MHKVDPLNLNRDTDLYKNMSLFRYMIHEEKEGPLAAMSVRDFVMTVGARSATPGGGSVAALVASLVSKT